MQAMQVCSCGNVFMRDELYCRRCGGKRPENFGDSTQGTVTWQATSQRMRSQTPVRTEFRSGTSPPHSPVVTNRAMTPGMAVQALPMAPMASAVVTGVDRNRDGIPDFLQQQTVSPATFAPAVMNTPAVVNTSQQLATAPTTTMGVVTDVCQMSPALRAWIDCQVDSRVEAITMPRVEQAFRQIASGEFPNMVTVARKEAQGAAQTALLQADQRERRLEDEMRCMWDAQARVLTLFEGISRDAERFFTNNKTRSEAFVTVEKVMSTIDELQRTVEQDGDGATVKLRQHEAAISDLKRTLAEESARQKAALADVQRSQGEATVRQRQNIDELANACGTIGVTRQEVSDLAQLVQRLEFKLSSWRTELAAEVADEVRSIARERDVEAETERQKTEVMMREAREGRSALEARLESFRSELSQVVASRGELENRIKELAALLRRVTAEMRAEVSKEIHAETTSREQEARDATLIIECLRREIREITASIESLRREASSSNASRIEIEERIERLQGELIATREAFEFRTRENHEELRKTIDSWTDYIPEELAGLQRRIVGEIRAETRAVLKSEQHTITAIDEQLWLTDQRLGQRIDELVQAQERTAVMLQVSNDGRIAAKANSSRSQRTPSPANSSRSQVVVEELHASAEAGARSPIRVNGVARSPSKGNSSAPNSLSETEQLERLRSARRLPGKLREPTSSHPTNGVAEALKEEAGLDRGGAHFGSSAGGVSSSILATCHKAAEAFDELANRR